jgi:hypothetical protein
MTILEFLQMATAVAVLSLVGFLAWRNYERRAQTELAFLEENGARAFRVVTPEELRQTLSRLNEERRTKSERRSATSFGKLGSLGGERLWPRPR